MMNCIFNWSGGKDSALALFYCFQNTDINIRYLVTTINDKADRISMHGVRVELLKTQAEHIGIPLYQIRLPEMPDMETYGKTMRHHLDKFRQEGITHAIYGDIFLENLKEYRDERLAEAGLTGIYPLWKCNTDELINEFLKLGFKTIIVCTQARLKDIVGQVLTHELISSLPDDVDVCGENGEFHTFTFEGPIFSALIKFKTGEKVYHELAAPTRKSKTDSLDKNQLTTGFWYCDLIVSE